MNQLEDLISKCDDCKFAACEQCEINWTQVQEIKKLIQENKKIKRQLKIKNEYLRLIYAFGFDYDGFDTIKSLKELIDEMCDLSIKGISNDDKSIIYGGKFEDLDMGVPKNILGEEVEQNES